MTKTLTFVPWHRHANPSMLEMLPSVKIANGSFVWDFESGSLGIICNLVLEIWDF